MAYSRKILDALPTMHERVIAHILNDGPAMTHPMLRRAAMGGINIVRRCIVIGGIEDTANAVRVLEAAAIRKEEIHRDGSGIHIAGPLVIRLYAALLARGVDGVPKVWPAFDHGDVNEIAFRAVHINSHECYTMVDGVVERIREQFTQAKRDAAVGINSDPNWDGRDPVRIRRDLELPRPPGLVAMPKFKRVSGARKDWAVFAKEWGKIGNADLSNPVAISAPAIEPGTATREVRAPKHRNLLRGWALAVYGPVCAITGRVYHLEQIDTVHIKERRDCEDNESAEVHNILLMRKDIHAMFSHHRFGINPENGSIVYPDHETRRDDMRREFVDRIPVNSAMTKFLEFRFDRFLERTRIGGTG